MIYKFKINDTVRRLNEPDGQVFIIDQKSVTGSGINRYRLRNPAAIPAWYDEDKIEEAGLTECHEFNIGDTVYIKTGRHAGVPLQVNEKYLGNTIYYSLKDLAADQKVLSPLGSYWYNKQDVFFTPTGDASSSTERFPWEEEEEDKSMEFRQKTTAEPPSAIVASSAINDQLRPAIIIDAFMETNVQLVLTLKQAQELSSALAKLVGRAEQFEKSIKEFLSAP
jgi:hypothetical protein